MVLCERCGSISIVKATPVPLERWAALFSSSRPFLCRRCGWRGRRDWSDRDFEALSAYGAGGAEPDPTLSALDEPQQRKRRKQRKAKASEGREDPRVDMGLKAIDLETAIPAAPPDTHATPQRLDPSVEHRLARKRRSRARRREVIGTIAVTSLLMFLGAVLSLTGSCSNASGDGAAQTQALPQHHR